MVESDPVLSVPDALEWLRTPDAADESLGSLFAVDLREASGRQIRELGEITAILRALPCVSLAVAPMLEEVSADRNWADGFDVVVDGGLGVEPAAAVAGVEAAVRDHPFAALAAAQVLRLTSQLDVAGGLVVESLAYSMLQSGPEFNAWLEGRSGTRVRGPAHGDPVVADRQGSRLTVVFNRPEVRNAVNVATRDGLVDLLRGPGCDPAIHEIVLRGAGPAFCSGGDLDEFGTFGDPATAHQTRLARSAAWWTSRIGPRLRAELHGACVGAGIELAAWARDVIARADTFALLPEVSMGLIPGAGGTVSLPRRIGRHRTAYLAITGERIDVERMRTWGLVDRIAEVS